MAAIAGVCPWDYSLRELFWFADAVRMESWDKTGWLAYHIPFTGGKGNWQDYNPLRRAERLGSVKRMREDLAEATNRMPDKMTNEEIDAAWAEHLKQE